MKSDRINYVLVGAFTLAMLVALFVSVYTLRGPSISTDTYFTHYTDASGLKYGSRVLYMGFPVGQVESVRPELTDGEVRFAVEMSITSDFRDWKVPVDSVAEVRATGLLAAIAIDIRSGRSETTLQPGGRIIGRGRADVLGAVSDTANTLRHLTETSVRPLLENLNQHVSNFGQVLEHRGGPLLDSLSTLTEQLALRAPEMIDDFLRTTSDLRVVSERLGSVLSEDNATRASTVMDNLSQSSEQLLMLTQNARSQLDVLLGAATVGAIQQTVNDAGAAASDALAITRSARERVLSADNLQRIDDALVSIGNASAGAEEVLGKVNRERVARTLSHAETASQSLDGLVVHVRDQITSLIGPQTSARLDQALVNVANASANIAELSEALDARLGEVLTPAMALELKRALANFSNASSNIASLTHGLTGSRRQLDALLNELNATAKENRPQLRSSVRHLRHSLRAIADNVDSVATNLEGTSRNLYELSRRLKSNPGLLLRTPAQPDAAGAASGG